MDVKLFIMIAPVRHSPYINEIQDDGIGHLKEAHDELSSLLDDAKGLTTTAIRRFRQFTLWDTTAKPQNILTRNPLEQFKERVHRINEIFREDPLIALEGIAKGSDGILRDKFTADLLSKLVSDELRNSIERKFITQSSAKNLTDLFPTKLFGNVADLLFSTLDYLLNLKDNKSILGPTTLITFQELIEEIAETLSHFFKSLSRDQKNQVQTFAARLCNHSNNLQSVMNGFTKTIKGNTLRDTILDIHLPTRSSAIEAQSIQKSRKVKAG